MWDHESQRIGKQKCTPWGYRLHEIAELLEFIGLLLFFGVGIYLGYRGLSNTFHLTLLWLIAVPFGIGLVSQVMYQFSWVMALKRGFEYDYDKREASWIENGERVTYRYSSEQNHRW
ncbi:MAG: hypothetical protein CME33_19795 [Gimesia sp.]|nr:hypothetical protein [Gimesia sp.]|tara:strand:+ start:203 stop:553 length:351 start_codon:yes stop_codon:yes gene_type:complete